ncbi:hypothetical protein CYMTET_38584, partial [Cymbomonas tetramitiformis]
MKKTCAACSSPKPKEAFSKKQWSAQDRNRRCTECIEAKRSVNLGFVGDSDAQLVGRGGHVGGEAKGDGSSRKHNKRLSMALSRILRHRAVSMNIELRPDGFCRVDDLLVLREFSAFDVEDVKEVVKCNDKQRFTLKMDKSTGIAWIRANQGHTMRCVKDGLLLRSVADAREIPICVHGTYWESWLAIRKEGLCRMSRNHIHFMPGEPRSGAVISGMRSNCEVLVYIDTSKAMAAGIDFFRSANNVLLTPGTGPRGLVGPDFFEKVIDVATGKVVFTNSAAREDGTRRAVSEPYRKQSSNAETFARGAVPECGTVTVGNMRYGGKGGGSVEPSEFVQLRIDRQTPLGNPFPMGEGGHDEKFRDDVCNAYEELIEDPSLTALEHIAQKRGLRIDARFRNDRALNEMQEALRDLEERMSSGEDLRLMCWCHPKRCHGDGLVKLIRKRIGGMDQHRATLKHSTPSVAK